MENIELVIKIPEFYYENNIQKELPIYLSEDNIIAILPKNHGRLVDGDELEDEFGCGDRDIYAKEFIREAPTIIEADKEDKE